MQLTEFKRSADNSFHLKFDDSFETDITSETLRENCPCASCRGEEVLFHKYTPPEKQLTAESYILEKAQMTGNYAIQLFWKDGHNTGIYNWAYLREICSK